MIATMNAHIEGLALSGRQYFIGTGRRATASGYCRRRSGIREASPFLVFHNPRRSLEYREDESSFGLFGSSPFYGHPPKEFPLRTSRRFRRFQTFDLCRARLLLLVWA